MDVLNERSEQPQAIDGKGTDPGDASLIRLELHGPNLARRLGLPSGQPALLSFRADAIEDKSGTLLAGLGSQFLDGLLGFVSEEWGDQLPSGAVFLDEELPAGQTFLLWFILAGVRDGHGDTVTNTIFAVRQTAEKVTTAPAYALGDLIPTRGGHAVPASLLALSMDPRPVLNWCLARQQLTWLGEVRAGRKDTVRMRREPMLSDARRALAEAQETLDTAVFGLGEDLELERKAGDRLAATQARLQRLKDRFQREETCSLVWPRFWEWPRCCR